MGINIVGAGLFGQVIAARLREVGHDVRVFDRRQAEAGSVPSGGHLKPSWLTAIPKKDLERALETLDRLYKVETLTCRFAGLKDLELLRVDVETVLSTGHVIETDVTCVGDGWMKYVGPDGEDLTATGTVIVAAGYWTGELIPSIKHLISGRKGMSTVYVLEEGVQPMPNIIVPWAPYKQIVRTSHGPGQVWIGDGTAIKPENWTTETERKIQDRVSPYTPDLYKESLTQRGIRPYTIGEGLGKVADHLWYATGGGKSGMALAAVYANRLAEIL